MRRLTARCLPLLFVAAQGWAAAPGPEATDARALALGGAYRALAETVAAARFNPAGLSPRRGFFVGGTYHTSPVGAADGVELTLVDNVTSPFGGALQYTHYQGDEEREEISLSLSAGEGKQASGLWWGFTVRYVQARDRSGGEWSDLVTSDVGFLVERPGGLRIGVVGYDVLDSSSDFLNRRVALGLSKSSGAWTLAADVLRNLDQDVSNGVNLHLGGEYRLGEGPWALRGGYQWRGDTREDYASAGVGWSLPGSLSAGYGLQKSRQDPRGYLHALSLEGSF